MTTFSWLLVTGLLITLLWISWRYISLRRNINSCTRALRRAGESDKPGLSLLPDIKDIEPLSKAVRSLAET